MGKKYKNPSIIEAFCEFQFEPDSPWDLTMPGLIYEEVKDTFPIRRPQTFLTGVISRDEKGIIQKIEPKEKMLFFHKDEKSLIQIAEHLLAINQLKPYSSWEEFFPLIKEGFNAYKKIATPKGIHRIGLKYINQIDVDKKSIEYEDYFLFGPHMGEGLPKNYNKFIVGIDFPKESTNDILRVTLKSFTPKRKGSISIIFDLDFFCTNSMPIDEDKIFGWINSAHNNIEKAFESCITDKVREILEEIK
jgi:uncharacterized protein (TIGR04255 family)